MNPSTWVHQQPSSCFLVYSNSNDEKTTTTLSQYQERQNQQHTVVYQPESTLTNNELFRVEEECLPDFIPTNVILPLMSYSDDIPEKKPNVVTIHTEDYKKQKDYLSRTKNRFSIPRALQKAVNENEGEVDDTIERILGSSCIDEYCRKAEFRFCSTFSEETRKKIFNEFWKNMNWDQRHIFIATHVFRKPNQSKTVKKSEPELIYTLRNCNGSAEQVCQNMFVSTLALDASTIDLWVQKYSIGGDGVSKYKEEFKKQLATIKIYDPNDYDETGQPKKRRKHKKKAKKQYPEYEELQNFCNNTDVDLGSNDLENKKQIRKDYDPNCPDKPPKQKNTIQPEYWKCNIAKRRRLEGEDYYSKHSKTGELILRKGKELGKRCESNMCKTSKLRHCSEISEETRERIFSDVWKRWDWNQRKVWVASMVKQKPTARNYTLSINSRRQTTLHYYLPDDNGIPVQVCRTMFINTSAIGHHQILIWITSFSLGSGLDETLTSVKDAEHHANDWFDSLPKYFLKKSQKFLDPYFKTVGDIYKCYTEICEKNGVNKTERYQIKALLRHQNIKLVPQNDEICQLCKFGIKKPKTKTEETFEYHTARIQKATSEILRDRKKSQAGTSIVLQVHLQPTKTVPILRTEERHIKSKLLCNNLTIYNVNNNFSTCYFFSEDQCSQIDKNIESIFASIICEYIKEHCISFKMKLPIIIYSSGEVDQTRNIVVSNALLNLATIHNLNISQKFFEEGHSLVEDCFKVYQQFERYIQTKNKEIYLPSQFAKTMREIKKSPDIFTGIHMDYDFFYNYSLPEHFRYKSIHPGDGFDEKDVCEMRYNSNGKIQLKVDFIEEYMELLQKTVKDFKPILEYPKLFTEMAVIPKSKWEDLQDLKKFMPFDCQPFYDSLKYYED